MVAGCFFSFLSTILLEGGEMSILRHILVELFLYHKL